VFCTQTAQNGFSFWSMVSVVLSNLLFHILNYWNVFYQIGHLWLIHTYHAVPMPRPWRSLPCRAAKGLDCVFAIWFTECGRVWFTHSMPRPCHATTMPFWQRRLNSTAQRGMGMAWHVWISIGLPGATCGRPAFVRLLPATTRSSTKVVIKSIPIR
jgi:hypothetical protein